MCAVCLMSSTQLFQSGCAAVCVAAAVGKFEAKCSSNTSTKRHAFTGEVVVRVSRNRGAGMCHSRGGATWCFVRVCAVMPLLGIRGGA